MGSHGLSLPGGEASELQGEVPCLEPVGVVGSHPALQPTNKHIAKPWEPTFIPTRDSLKLAAFQGSLRGKLPRVPQR